MNKSILFFLIFTFLNLFLGCSKDSETNTPIEYPTTAAKINSFSKNFGYTGETITIIGENFTDKLSDVSLKFDEIPATIVSATNTEIKCILPFSAKVIPKLNLSIANRNITNLVVNNYESNIGILPSVSYNSWFAVENSLKSGNVINRVQMVNNKTIYYTMEGGGTLNVVYRTLDDGVSWQFWSPCGFPKSAFKPTNSDDGWAYTGFGLKKVPVGGSSFINHIWVGTYIISINVNETLNMGTCVSDKGVVNITSDGTNFSEVYSSSINVAGNGQNTGLLFNSFEIDDNHIWSSGFKQVSYNSSNVGKPFILYKNNTTDGWKESVIIQAENNSSARQVQFFLNNIGYVLIHAYDNSNGLLVYSKIFKSFNGGDTWTSTDNIEKFTNFTFKDENTGWAILENKIYKTTNGGTSWQLDYTHNQNLRNISYKDNVIWAFSTDKILKYYIQ